MNIKILQNELVQKNKIIRSLLEIIRQCSILYHQQEINQRSQICINNNRKNNLSNCWNKINKSCRSSSNINTSSKRKKKSSLKICNYGNCNNSSTNKDITAKKHNTKKNNNNNKQGLKTKRDHYM